MLYPAKLLIQQRGTGDIGFSCRQTGTRHVWDIFWLVHGSGILGDDFSNERRGHEHLFQAHIGGISSGQGHPLSGADFCHAGVCGHLPVYGAADGQVRTTDDPLYLRSNAGPLPRNNRSGRQLLAHLHR